MGPDKKLTTIGDDARILFENVYDFASTLTSPTVRLGVTGLSRAGKTVFITSLVNALLNGASKASISFPLFEPYAGGRVSGARLDPQPSMHLPRFEYETHLKDLLEKQVWPQSTSNISELRVRIAYESQSTLKQALGPGILNVDIVDYPGEWLLDLPLLAMSYEEWCHQTFELSQLGNRKNLAAEWLKQVKKVDGQQDHDEALAQKLTKAFTNYLNVCRQDENALSTLPPGRFLMPGDMEGSPALTFFPLKTQVPAKKGSLHEQMQARFEAYKELVVRPFFTEHFARLDRQIVLVDVLSAINAGPLALKDLQFALNELLGCFSAGKSSWLSSMFSKRITKLVFAATKADHLHHSNHDKLEAILDSLVQNSVKEAKFSGAGVDVMALASLRSTKEAQMEFDGEMLPVIVGTPINGEKIDGETFDGKTKTAIFPGDLPDNPLELLTAQEAATNTDAPLNFIRFKPDINIDLKETSITQLPHIRMDKAMHFLLSDYLE